VGKTITAAIVGAGHRAVIYADYALRHPGELRITAVADPDRERCLRVARHFGLGPEACYNSAGELAAVRPRVADVVINGTMDHQHVPTSLPLIEAGYHLLLEKPFAVSEEEMAALLAAARRHERRVIICHVLRFAPFYSEMRRRILGGEIGEIINLQLNEHVSFHHVAVSFVRGKHGSKAKCHSGMLLAKSCHDLDLIVWLNGESVPTRVASVGSRSLFRPEKAPAGAGKNCLIDCPAEVESACLYSARKHYLLNPERWQFYVWAQLEGVENPTLAQKEALLKDPANPYGRCVFHHDNDVVDRQSVAIDFANGSTATLNMIGGTAKGSRSVHIVGERGEIFGRLEDAKFTVRRIVAGAGTDFEEEVVDLQLQSLDTTGASGGHGGGENYLMRDFCAVMRGEAPSICTTSLEDSIYSHQLAFSADRSMENRTVEEIPKFDK
jgi:predicted dehydrogenase